MTHDDLRKRLQRTDPVPPQQQVDQPDGPAATALRHSITSNDPADGWLRGNPRADRGRWKRPMIGAAASSAVVLVAVIAALAVHDGGGETTAPSTAKRDAPSVVRYNVPTGETLCAASPAELIPTLPPPTPDEVAFSGRVTSRGPDQPAGFAEPQYVVLDVDHWYAGGDADVVVLEFAAYTVSDDVYGFFAEGEHYHVAVSESEEGVDGGVLACLSGRSTPELEQAYEERYG